MKQLLADKNRGRFSSPLEGDFDTVPLIMGGLSRQKMSEGTSDFNDKEAGRLPTLCNSVGEHILLTCTWSILQYRVYVGPQNKS